MSGARTERAGRSFVDFWAEKIYPKIQDDYAAMLRKAPTRLIARKQAKADKKVKKKDKKDRKAAASDGLNQPETEEKDDEDEQSDRDGGSKEDTIKDIATAVREKKETRNVHMNLA